MRFLSLVAPIVLLSPWTCSGDEPCSRLAGGIPAALEWWNSGDSDTSPDCGCRQSGCRSDATVDPISGLHLDESGSWKLGGSYRIRYHNENNMRRSGLTGVDDEFVLHQTRLWCDAQLNDRLQMRVGFIDAASFGEDIAPRGNEVNRSDLYQLYADVLLQEGEEQLTVRLGRQEMRYGSDRLIMAPIWANRRRTHDGVRFMWKTPDWDVDAFWVRPVYRDAAHFTTFDSANQNQQLYGVFSTYKSLETSKVDLYWLAFDFVNGAGGARFDTFGSRYFGSVDSWLYEFEGGVQAGTNQDDTSHSAGFFTGGLGRKFQDTAWKPEAWVFYDWASGSSTTGNGFHTYVQRAHYYLGFMDLFGRRNLEDINVRIVAKPTEKLTLILWYHYFMLATGQDVPYNLNMRPASGLAAGSAGSQELGHELDLVLTCELNKQTQLRVGYSYFWAGRFYDTTPGVPTNSDADFFYSHFSYKF